MKRRFRKIKQTKISDSLYQKRCTACRRNRGKECEFYYMYDRENNNPTAGIDMECVVLIELYQRKHYIQRYDTPNNSGHENWNGVLLKKCNGYYMIDENNKIWKTSDWREAEYLRYEKLPFSRPSENVVSTKTPMTTARGWPISRLQIASLCRAPGSHTKEYTSLRGNRRMGPRPTRLTTYSSKGATSHLLWMHARGEELTATPITT